MRHGRERRVVQREGLHTGVYVEASALVRGISRRFDHNIGGTELGVVRAENPCGFKVDAIFTICPSREWDERSGDMEGSVANFVVDGCFWEFLASEKMITEWVY